MKYLCVRYINLVFATFILSQTSAWAGKNTSDHKPACTKDRIAGSDEAHDKKSQLYTLGAILDDDGATLADSVLKILEVSRVLSESKNISKLIATTGWQYKKYIAITEDEHKKILENKIELNSFHISCSEKTGETITKSLKKQVRESAKEFDKLADIDPPLTQESQDVLNIILNPKKYPFSKNTIENFYEELEDNNGTELSAPEWIDSHDNETFLSLVFLNKLWKEPNTPKIQKPKKLQKWPKRLRTVSQSDSPDKQTLWKGFRIPKKKAKPDPTHDVKTNLTVNSGFAGKDNPFRFDKTDK
jgi:hypothetical protein